MINRTMVRTRVLQTLFAYLEDGDKTLFQAKKELTKSFSDTYNLYAMLLSLADELATYAKNQIAEAHSRARATHTNYVPVRHFADNAFSAQVFDNYAIRHILENNHLSWDAGMSAFPALFKQLQATDYFQQYMALENPSYEDDKALWRKIYSDLLPDNEILLEALEEMEVSLDQQNWCTDLNVVLSYVVKTVKRFRRDAGAQQPLLEMFDNDNELQFAEQLLTKAVEHQAECDNQIKEHLQNWEPDRIAHMDHTILLLALTELYYFPEIAPQVSLNEYIELTKEYSSDKSYLFVNGILDGIVKEKINCKL
ncbi:MAG: transcription antitermination factor NusB [Paludibacteraceae bacterium]|nr:transcription antitermination factor NusB [Paludibacteraceae bacterium]